MSEQFIAYITKYALTSGIEEILVRTHPTISDSMVSAVLENPGLISVTYHGEGREWHRTRESAKQRAETMRDAKIVSLKKSISKLEKMIF